MFCTRIQRWTAPTLLTLQLAAPAALHGQAPTSQIGHSSTLVGTVTDTAGRPIAAANITEAMSHATSVSDSAGRFRLDGVHAGLAQLQVWRVGYLRGEFSLLVRPDTTLRVAVQLAIDSVAMARAADPSAPTCQGRVAHIRNSTGHPVMFMWWNGMNNFSATLGYAPPGLSEFSIPDTYPRGIATPQQAISTQDELALNMRVDCGAAARPRNQ
ncbi:MAG: carboxypeptidase-like regulatory domain-containing protein [Hyphomicrobiales bacterium]